MRTEIEEVKDRRTAKRRMPWAAVIVKVCGGYKGFESVTDWQIWINQT